MYAHSGYTYATAHSRYTYATATWGRAVLSFLGKVPRD